MVRPHWVSFTGFCVLALLTLILAVLSVIQAYFQHPLLSVMNLVILLGIGAGIVMDGKALVTSSPPDISLYHDLLDFIAVAAGAMLTFIISTEFKTGAVIASGTVGLIGGILFRRHAAALFCGSFAGMSSPELLTLVPGMLLASLLAGLIYVAVKESFAGIGGKLGTTAYAGCLIAAILLDCRPIGQPVPGWDTGWIIMLYAVCGALITYILNHRMRAGPVIASAAVGLVAGILLPVMHGVMLGEELAVMVFCASFAGMAGKKQAGHTAFMVIAGVVCGLLYIFTLPYLGGAGGKLGTIAFASVLFIRTLRIYGSRFNISNTQRVSAD